MKPAIQQSIFKMLCTMQQIYKRTTQQFFNLQVKAAKL